MREERHHHPPLMDTVLRNLEPDVNLWAYSTFPDWVNINQKLFRTKQEKIFFYRLISLQFSKIIDLSIVFTTVWLGGDTLLISDNLDFSGTHSILY